VDLHAAICKAQEYNIPLIQICILSAEGERTVKEKVLTNFTISHFINQNFVLYGDWEVRQNIFSALDVEVSEKIGDYDPREGIYLRKGELIYAFISLEKI
jgi:ethanolamine ammonia-lyase large subunit